MNIDRNPEVCAHTTVDKDTYFHEMSIYSASRGSAHEDYDRDDYFANRYGLGFKTWMGDDEGLYKLADGNADYDTQYNDNRRLKYSPTFSFRHANFLGRLIANPRIAARGWKWLQHGILQATWRLLFVEAGEKNHRVATL